MKRIVSPDSQTETITYPISMSSVLMSDANIRTDDPKGAIRASVFNTDGSQTGVAWYIPANADRYLSWRVIGKV